MDTDGKLVWIFQTNLSAVITDLSGLGTFPTTLCRV